MSCQSNSTAVCRVVHYKETETPELYLKECALVARYYDISSKADRGDIISHIPTPKVVKRMCLFEYSCKCLSLCEVIMIAVCCCIICQLRVHSVLSPLWWMNPWLSWHLSMCSIALPWRWAQMPSRWPIQAGLRSYLDYHMSAPSLCSITVQRSTSVGFSVLSSFLMMCWCHRQGFSWHTYLTLEVYLQLFLLGRWENRWKDLITLKGRSKPYLRTRVSYSLMG